MGDSRNDAGAPESEVVPGLYWGIRESFVDYVSGNPDGQVFGDAGAETDGEGTFRFPLASAARSGGSWRIEFYGVVRFIAHGGMLDVTLDSPVLSLDDTNGSLLVGEDALAILDVEPADPVEIAGGWLIFPPLATRLTPAGVALFGDVYGTGTPFAPLQVALPVEAGAA